MKISFQVFMDFLRNSNAESAFQKNYMEQNGGVKLTEEDWNDLNIPLEIALPTLLDWDQTPEGRRFWQRVDNYFQRRFVDMTACTLAPKISCGEDVEEPQVRQYYTEETEEDEPAVKEEREPAAKGDAAWDSFFFS